MVGSRRSQPRDLKDGLPFRRVPNVTLVCCLSLAEGLFSPSEEGIHPDSGLQVREVCVPLSLVDGSSLTRVARGRPRGKKQNWMSLGHC